MAASSSASLYAIPQPGVCQYCQTSSPSTRSFSYSILQPNNPAPSSSNLAVFARPEPIDMSFTEDNDAPSTPMRLTGLVGPHERTEDQDPPPKINGPFYVVLLGKDNSIGDYYICGVFTDLDVAVQCTSGCNPPFAFNCFDVAWWYWTSAWQARATAPHLHPLSLWHSIVTYDVLMERGRHNTHVQRSSSSSAPSSPTVLPATPTAQAGCSSFHQEIAICTPPGTPL
ncbi:hypothetical protein NM688_g3431 [Phlebia brevispora]|uniref:Uncharacterized protein n=1 Tax=Phlebia brevispora TaxID=194682 RepID=A0ACC1T660_9APHY|nr:hypothetical protein NM688_g3431 [Phlebia brevispora]